MRTRPGQSKAYIAIEDSKNRNGRTCPGTPGKCGAIYLVWLKPELSGILPDEWPYKIAGLRSRAGCRVFIPIFRGAEDAMSRGVESVSNNLFACHTMNHEGPSWGGRT
jgi:hypothetical protein